MEQRRVVREGPTLVGAGHRTFPSACCLTQVTRIHIRGIPVAIKRSPTIPLSVLGRDGRSVVPCRWLMVAAMDALAAGAGGHPRPLVDLWILRARTNLPCTRTICSQQPRKPQQPQQPDGSIDPTTSHTRRVHTVLGLTPGAPPAPLACISPNTGCPSGVAICPLFLLGRSPSLHPPAPWPLSPSAAVYLHLRGTCACMHHHSAAQCSGAGGRTNEQAYKRARQVVNSAPPPGQRLRLAL
ncbi:hypothetical protein EDB80DRAFT_807223 [Ilyonectria destructans]|nr:hypothetical protein EDB80DRAFT_807223 [Ilyonectria destructans]